MWSQHVITCEEAHALGLTEEVHPDCTVIFCRDEERDWVAWVSHGGSPGDRCNPDLDTTDWTDTSTPDPLDGLRVYDFVETAPKDPA